MQKSSKTSVHKVENNQSQDEASTHDESRSEEENNQEVVLDQSHIQQSMPSMFMPYIEGPKIDWTVNDGLYHRFLKWRLKCENLLVCELAILAERRKGKTLLP